MAEEIKFNIKLAVGRKINAVLNVNQLGNACIPRGNNSINKQSYYSVLLIIKTLDGKVSSSLAPFYFNIKK